MARTQSVEWLVAGVVGVASGVLIAACGSNDGSSPEPLAPSDIAQCRGFDQLMPNFVKALNTGRTENLKVVVENQLLKPVRPGDPPPANDVLRAVFMTLSRLATKPKEPGATGDQYCATASNAPPLEQSNELCEMRRSLDMLVHQGKGLDALKLVRPQLLGLLNYIIGKSTDKTPHYEIAAIFSGLCAQDANCQLSNGLDLVIAFADYSRTTDGKKLFQDLNDLITKPSPDGGPSPVSAFLDPTKFKEDDFVNLAKFLIPVINSASPAQLDDLFNSGKLPLPADLKAAMKPVVDDMKTMLGHPELMGPTKKGLMCIWGEAPQTGSTSTCWSGKDGCNFDLLRMMYRLAIRDALPEFGVTRLVGVLKGLQDVDTRGSLMYLAGTLSRAIRSDDQAIDSAAAVCRTLLSNNPVAGQARPNAQMVTPVLADLVEAGVVEEGLCAADTLLFGCAGGKQPACPTP